VLARLTGLIGVIGLLLSDADAPASAAAEFEKPLGQMVAEAELIFQGTVTKIEHGMVAQEIGKQPPLPFTYVTYRIEEAHKGRSVEGDRVTLSFLGGPTPDGRRLTASHYPSFKVGDRDVLFVRRNLQADCPLVDCAKGRLRIIKDRIYSDSKQPIVAFRDGELVYGKREGRSEQAMRLKRFKEAVMNEIGQRSRGDMQQALQPVPSAKPGEPQRKGAEETPPPAVPPAPAEK
jgi:hypothetical protein